MKPYYDHAGIQIFHGDCRDVLPTLPKVDLVLTDPPYGIARDGMRLSTSSHGGRKPYEFLGWDDAPPDSKTFRLIFDAGRNHIIWGGNYFAAHLPSKMGWLVWDKGQRICGSDGELAFTSFDAALRIHTLNRVAIAQDGAVHPTQKPIALMLWCIGVADKHVPVESICDPYAGSGSTLVAAKLAGRKAIGIEIEERYCEIAANRLAQQVLEFA